MIQTIKVSDEVYQVLVVKVPPRDEKIDDWIEQNKKQYYLCDSVLRLNEKYYFCSKAIEAEFEELSNEEIDSGKLTDKHNQS